MSRACIIFLLACTVVPSAAFNLRHQGSSLVQGDNEKPATIYEKGIPDPTCKTGVISPDFAACCTDECGLCGNHKLCDAPGKLEEKTGKLADNCCKDRILEAAKSCDDNHPPCVLSPSYIKKLDKWAEKMPKRHAMHDCTKAESISRLRHACGVDKGEALGRLYVAQTGKLEDTIEIAKKVVEKLEAKGEKAEERIKDPAVKDFINKRAEKLETKAKDGLEDIKELREELIEAKCVGDKHEMKLNTLESEAEVIHRDVETLDKVWEELADVKEAEAQIAAVQSKLDVIEAKINHLNVSTKMLHQDMEHHQKAKVIPAGEQVEVLKKTQKSMKEKLEGEKGKSDEAESLQERLKMMEKNIANAIDEEKTERRKHSIMETEYGAAKKAADKELKELEADKEELEKAKAKEVELRDKAQAFLTMEIDKYTTTTTTTTMLTIVNASGNNGAAYCSAYCAYNWNDQCPSFWKGACCLKAYNANTMEEVSCTAYGSGAGTICTCQMQDSTPFLTGAGEGGSYGNMDNVCADATGIATLTPTTTTTTTTNLDCNCFHCGSSDPFNNADVCGAASGSCGPSSPDNGGCWTNRNSACVCGTHTLVQSCECYHCGGSDPFPQADVCGAASGACGPNSPGEGCWTNVNGNCQCNSMQTTGR